MSKETTEVCEIKEKVKLQVNHNIILLTEV